VKRIGLPLVSSLILCLGCDMPIAHMGQLSNARAGLPGAAARPIHASVVQQPKLDPARRERLVIYNGAIHLVVERISDTLDRIKTTIEGMGGYMQEMSANSITVKVPAEKFHDAIAMVEKLGEVTKKEIKGADVTDQVRDLRIRLENAERLRKRLLKLLEKSDKVEDTLKVEKELARVTETIELLKGRLRYIESKVAFSTLTVHVNSPLPQREIAAEIPFAWVRRLGADLTRGTAGSTSAALPFWRGMKFRLPDAYIKYFESDDETRAMSAEGVMIRLQRHENFRGGGLDFWAALVRRALVEQRAFAIKDQVDLELRTGVAARLFVASKEIGGKPYGYLVAVVARRHHVYTLEAWGPLENFTADRPKLEKAIRSLRAGPWYRLLLTMF